METYARRGMAAFCCGKNRAVFLAVKIREVNPHERRETRVYRLYHELLLSLKDVAPNFG